MDKKSVSATILILFLALFFMVVGASFSAFVYSKKRTLLESVKVVSVDGVGLFQDKAHKKVATELKLSNMDLGLKPATGEVDAETKVPSTITDKGTSEGYYASIYVDASASFRVVVKDIKIESNRDEMIVREERKNIFIAIKDVKNSAKSFEDDEFEIASFSNVESLEKLTFYIWLSAFASGELEGAKISFVIEFIAL